LCELQVAVVNSSRSEKYSRQLRHLLKRIRIWPLDESVSVSYAKIYNFVKAQGRVLSQVDMMLAALSQQMRLVLLTADQDFAILSELRTENWLAVSPS
jgi:predicted nucleic acid-binding protein